MWCTYMHRRRWHVVHVYASEEVACGARRTEVAPSWRVASSPTHHTPPHRHASPRIATHPTTSPSPLSRGPSLTGGATDRSWLPHFTIDHYSGTDFAWAWNAPLFQVSGAQGVR